MGKIKALSASVSRDKKVQLALVVIMAAMIVVGMMTMAFGGVAFADVPVGSEANPIMISTPEQLASLGVDYLGEAHADKYFELANDIDLSAYLAPADEDAGTPAGDGYNDGAGWVSIGSYSVDGATIFHGHLDGAGFKVTGLWVNRDGEDYVGLFGYSRGTIKNLGVEMSDKTFSDLDIALTTEQATAGVELTDVVGVRGSNRVGGLVGNKVSGTITSCYVIGDVTAAGNNVGGLAGIIGGGGTITSSYATGAVTGKDILGGLVGYNNNSKIYSSYATGAVTGKNRIGGLVGFSDGTGTVTSSYATGAVTGSGTAIGGLVGDNRSTITSSYATGNVSGNRSVGGLVGMNSKGTITLGYATGRVTASSDVGGLAGHSSIDGTIEGCFFDKDTTRMNKGVGNNAEATGVYGKTTAEMKKKVTFTTWLTGQGETAWNFANTWAIVEGAKYPILHWQLDGSMFSGGTGSETDPYIIKTAEQLASLNLFVGDTYADTYFELGNDLTFQHILPRRTRMRAHWQAQATTMAQAGCRLAVTARMGLQFFAGI